MTAAYNNFVSHIQECSEANGIYEFLSKHGYRPHFGLRYVWVAAISSLDNYISELIVEKATENFSNGAALSSKLLNEGVPISAILKIQSATPVEAVSQFRDIMYQTVRFKTFQKAESVADGLSMIWNEENKWKKIAEVMKLSHKAARWKLNSIAYRRDLIVHNADYDVATGKLMDCNPDDAKEVYRFVAQLVEIVDQIV